MSERKPTMVKTKDRGEVAYKDATPSERYHHHKDGATAARKKNDPIKEANHMKGLRRAERQMKGRANFVRQNEKYNDSKNK